MLIPYRTVGGSGEVKFSIERSIFIASAARAESEQAAVNFISQVKKVHAAATHNCAAYIAGKRGEWQKADDDGEPSGTAGKPILEVLKKKQLTDMVIVVTRYYGGVKLGTGGLIRAYGRAATEVVLAVGIVQMQPVLRVEVMCDYALAAIIENKLRIEGYVVEEKEYNAQVMLRVFKSPTDSFFADKIADWSGGTAVVKEVGWAYVERRLPEG